MYFPVFARTAKCDTAWTILSFYFVLSLQVGCGPDPQSHVVARIAGQEITTVELQAFAARLPDGIHEGKSDSEANLMVLNALIDKKVLLAEAEAQQLQSDPGFVLDLSAFKDQEMMKLYNHLKVDRQISIAQEELTELYRDEAWDRALRLAAIVVETREKADELVAELNSGKAFRQLVDAYSVDETTKAWGGDTGRYLSRDTADESLQELLTLQVGDLSKPFPFAYKGKKHYAVFKVLDEMPIALNEVQGVLEEKIFGSKRIARRAALTDSLAGVYKPLVDADGVAFLAERSADGQINVSEAEATMRLGSYRDGDLTIGEFLSVVLHKAGPETRHQLADTALVAAKVRSLLTAQMLLKESYALGLDRDSTLVASVENERENILVSLLRKINVDSYVRVEEEEARAFYDKNPEKFRYLEATIAAEVLLSNKEEAQRVKEQLQAGADAEQLIAKYDTRGVHGKKRGFVRLDAYKRLHYPHLYDLSQYMEIGQVGGPIKVAEGYSVFKIVDREAAKLKPFNAASKKRATAYVRINKAKHGYVEFVSALRKKYDVEIFPTNVPNMIKDGKFQADN
jgi:peptidyl-prolyl cis-trans isomerase C